MCIRDRYVTLWDGVRDTTIWVMSRKTMNKLSPEDQELVKECAAEALDWGNDYLADNEAVIIQKLKDGGTVITELTAVSYTHLDVYKRQPFPHCQ